MAQEPKVNEENLINFPGQLQDFQIEGAQKIMWTHCTNRGTKREVPHGRGLGAPLKL